MTGEHILVIGGNAQAKVMDRDGFEVLETKKGYQYIVDQASTDVSQTLYNFGVCIFFCPGPCLFIPISNHFLFCDGSHESSQRYEVTQTSHKLGSCTPCHPATASCHFYTHDKSKFHSYVTACSAAKQWSDMGFMFCTILIFCVPARKSSLIRVIFSNCLSILAMKT